MTGIDAKHLIGLVVTCAALLLGEGRAHADCAGSSPPEEDAPCTVDDQCPGDGVSCNGGATDFAECKQGAESRGLTVRCEAEDLTIYCPEGAEARNVSTGVRPLACAGTTFGVALAVALARAQRRRRPGAPKR